MAEVKVICPNCRSEVPLKESLVASLFSEREAFYQKQLAAKDKQLAEHEAKLKAELNKLLEEERKKIAAQEAEIARMKYEFELKQAAEQRQELMRLLEERTKKYEEARAAQAEYERKKRELEEKERELNLTIEKRVNELAAAMRENERKQAQQEFELKLKEKDHLIESLSREISELKQKAEQGSAQLRGEVQELDLEQSLRNAFPQDRIEPVPKGQAGGDIIHHVISPTGQPCGKIVWECKRTKNWNQEWIDKLRQDRNKAGAELAVLVTHALPHNVEHFASVEGICVTHPQYAIPVSALLRQYLVELAMAKQGIQNQETKKDLIYQYMLSPQFRARVETVSNAFLAMKRDLDKEKAAITRQWSKREKQIEQAWLATVSMWGEVQAIIGNDLPKLKSLEFEALEAPDSGDADSNE